MSREPGGSAAPRDGAVPERDAARGLDGATLRAEVDRLSEELRTGAHGAVVHPWVSARLAEGVLGIARFEQYGRTFELWSDEAQDRAGGDRAPSPLRYLLASIAFCTQGWTAKVAALHEVRLDALAVDVRTTLDLRGEHRVGTAAAHPPWFVVDARVGSPAPSERVVDVVREALQRCPVSALVALAVPVHLVVRHEDVVVHDDRPDHHPVHEEAAP
jgi:uncharacterized OsmC-like protein